MQNTGMVSHLAGVVANMDRPTPEVFWEVAQTCAGSLPHSDLQRISRAINVEAWVEATHELLSILFPGQGFMAGRLPDGTAHVRIMSKRSSGGIIPVDTFRMDGDLALALLEAIVRTIIQQNTHLN